MSFFELDPGDHFVWNRAELLKFLANNQGQDITISTHYEGCCLTSNGVYDLIDLFKFNSVTVQTSNIFEQHPTYKIEYQRLFHFFKLPATTDYTQHHRWNYKNIFGGLYNRALWHRIGLTATLHDYPTTLNFRSDPHSEDSRRLFELQKLFEVDPTSAHKFVNLLDQLPTQLESVDGFTVGNTTIGHTDQLAQYYPNFLIDVVAETFVNGRSFFATEKTVRPMLLKKPFVIMGPKCYLIHLRQMGFRTFNDFWDENYDGFGPAERYKHILSLIDDLSKLSMTELKDMYQRMQPILDHNYNLLINQNYSKMLDYVE